MNGLMIQWGNFNNPKSVNQPFYVNFTTTPLMASTYTSNNAEHPYYKDHPRAVNGQYWTIPNSDSKNVGNWIAIGY